MKKTQTASKKRQDAWYVYMVECSDGSFYTGITNDIEKRVEKHNAGKGALYTKWHAPVKLIYQELIGTRSEALKREHQIKCLTRTQKLELLTERVK